MRFESGIWRTTHDCYPIRGRQRHASVVLGSNLGMQRRGRRAGFCRHSLKRYVLFILGSFQSFGTSIRGIDIFSGFWNYPLEALQGGTLFRQRWPCDFLRHFHTVHCGPFNPFFSCDWDRSWSCGQESLHSGAPSYKLGYNPIWYNLTSSRYPPNQPNSHMFTHSAVQRSPHSG